MLARTPEHRPMRTKARTIASLGILLIALTAAAASRPPVGENPILRRVDRAVVGGGFEMPGYWVWCSSVVKGDDGLYHMFASRWPKRLPFHPGWMVASEVVHATAKTAEGPYQFRDVALPARGAQYWDGRSTHNPRIVRHKDKYVLFYMGSTHPFDDITDGKVLTVDSPYATVGRSNKRIGVAVASSPFGPWKRMDTPALDTKAGTYYSFLTSNPAPLINEDGSAILVFKARAYRDKYPYQGDMTLGVARAPRYDGPYTVVSPEPIFGLGRGGEMEDPFLWKDAAGYHLLAKDQRGTITGEFHGGLLAHSPDALHWEIDKAPKAYSRTVTWSDGTVQVMGQLERAFPLIENGVITHLFFAAMDGSGGFQNGTRSWSLVVRMKK
jgi:hypothetical protein